MGTAVWQFVDFTISHAVSLVVGISSALLASILIRLIVRRLRHRRELHATYETYDGLHIDPNPSEHFADIGNQHVREIFGRSRVISYPEYKKWRAKNPTVYTVVANGKNELVGFFDIFPLTDAAGAALMKGEKSEEDLTIDDLLDGKSTAETNFVYIATLAARFRNPLLDVLLTRTLVEHLSNVLPPRPGRRYLIIPYTVEGRNAAIRNGFRCEATPSITKRNIEVFSLDSAFAARAVARLTNPYAVNIGPHGTPRFLFKIFLSYRRADEPGFAQALYERLSASTGEQSVFMDIEGQIKPGDSFSTVLRRSLAECDVLLAVIGPLWLAIDAASGRSRLFDSSDWVRAELVEANAANKRIVPVLVGSGKMPEAAHLPLELSWLLDCQAVRIRQENFGADTRRLIRALRGGPSSASPVRPNEWNG